MIKFRIEQIFGNVRSGTNIREHLFGTFVREHSFGNICSDDIVQDTQNICSEQTFGTFVRDIVQDTI